MTGSYTIDGKTGAVKYETKRGYNQNNSGLPADKSLLTYSKIAKAYCLFT